MNAPDSVGDVRCLDPQGHHEACRVWLYLAIPRWAERVRISRSIAGRIACTARRVLGFASWIPPGRPRFDYYAWQRFADSNLGDSLVREAIRTQLEKALSPRQVIFTELRWGQLNEVVAAGLDGRCDLFVLGGGGYLFLDEHGEFAPRLVDDIAGLRRLRCPKIAFGIGLNRLNEFDSGAGDILTLMRPGARSKIDDLARELDLISVRDDTTKKAVGPASGRQVYVSGDPVLHYAATINPPDSGRKSVPNGAAKTLRVGLNFALHGKVSANILEKNVLMYVKFIKKMAEKYTIDLFYIVHSDTERIIPQLLGLHGVRTNIVLGNLSESVSIYRTLDLHICQMLHSSILSVAAGVPTICIAYDTKNYAFFDMMGIGGYVVSSLYFEVSQALERCREALRQSMAIKYALQHRRQSLAACAEAFLDEIKRLDSLRSDGGLQRSE